MKKKYLINLNEIENIKNFVKDINQYEFPINVVSKDRSIEYDAKSIMALLSLDLSQPVYVIINNNINDNQIKLFEETIRKYE